MNHKTELQLRSEYGKLRGKLVSCTPKKRFKDYDLSCKVARITNIQNKKRGNSEIVVPYKCQFCGYWHLGKDMGVKKLRKVLVKI